MLKYLCVNASDFVFIGMFILNYLEILFLASLGILTMGFELLGFPLVK